MNLALFSTALLMTVVAMGFVAKPLIVSYERRSSGSAKLSLLGIIVVFGMGLVLYGVIGKPELSNIQATSSSAMTNAQPAQTGGTSDKVGSVTSLLTGLETRLAENPDDAKGWLLLAKSYDHLGRDGEARDAYAKAAALGMTDADLEARLDDATTAAAPTGAAIRGHVSIADSVADRVNPDDIIYVVAKTDGNPMPLAVLRRSAAELPFDFVLSDDNSMVQGGGISSASSVTISARLSKPGDALNAAATLGASSAAIDPQNAGDLSLVIDVVPGS
jgi:cytochrome c-type biogenesis protein CcmH